MSEAVPTGPVKGNPSERFIEFSELATMNLAGREIEQFSGNTMKTKGRIKEFKVFGDSAHIDIEDSMIERSGLWEPWPTFNMVAVSSKSKDTDITVKGDGSIEISRFQQLTRIKP